MFLSIENVFLKNPKVRVPNLTLDEFMETKKNAVLNATEKEMTDFASDHLKYSREKGLDFVPRICK